MHKLLIVVLTLLFTGCASTTHIANKVERSVMVADEPLVVEFHPKNATEHQVKFVKNMTAMDLAVVMYKVKRLDKSTAEYKTLREVFMTHNWEAMKLLREMSTAHADMCLPTSPKKLSSAVDEANFVVSVLFLQGYKVKGEDFESKHELHNHLTTISPLSVLGAGVGTFMANGCKLTAEDLDKTSA